MTDLAGIAADLVVIDDALRAAPLVDEIVVDVSVQGVPAVVSLRCGNVEFGWHEVPGGLEAVSVHVDLLAHEYGTKRLEIHGEHEAIRRFITDPLRQVGLHIREVK